ncbi:hybrid sensor histidine kinase/response regulator, partial [Longimicrobium sp.]|uniref:hybrid sensor histidine kinase/response regulator n=1 Tax=Longimicrobium sp. TaxID=2029185 RepID=UPI002F92420F
DPRTGDVRWLHTFKVRLTPPGGGDHQVLAVSTDITERTRAELALKGKEEELRQAQKLEAIGRLAGGVAHDFNNILTAVRGFAQVLLMDVDDTAVREDLLEIDRAGERGAMLARQLLAFSRKQVLHPRLVDLNDVVAGTHRMLVRLMGDDVELVVELAPEPLPVLADPGQLEQVIVNLMVNARDAMPDGGRITVGTRAVSGSGVPQVPGLYLAPGEDGVLLTVSDSGHGMDERTQARVFEPFFTTKPVGRGTGLGLSTVYGIVNQSGGSVGVRSAPGEGCTFFVLLPLAAQEAGEGAGEAASPLPPPAAATTVLLVEDEDPVRRSVRRMLERHGYAVLDAPDAHEALRVSATFPGEIHLLLTDVVMPQVKGPELARRVQAVRPGVRVVFMSGHTSGSGAFEDAGELPPNLLEKPFSLDQLLRHLHAALA